MRQYYDVHKHVLLMREPKFFLHLYIIRGSTHSHTPFSVVMFRNSRTKCNMLHGVKPCLRTVRPQGKKTTKCNFNLFYIPLNNSRSFKCGGDCSVSRKSYYVYKYIIIYKIKVYVCIVPIYFKRNDHKSLHATVIKFGRIP